MSYTLVVVDMQPGFRSAKGKRVRQNCRREIDQAVKEEAHIVFLEYNGYDSTMPELTNYIHEKCYFRQKFSDDGSEEVMNEVHLNRLPKHFKVCGINTDCCVLATVRGLTARFPMATIEVVADACDSDWNHFSGLEKMRDLKGNVKVINSKEIKNV